jgi:hypothetical protein
MPTPVHQEGLLIKLLLVEVSRLHWQLVNLLWKFKAGLAVIYNALKRLTYSSFRFDVVFLDEAGWFYGINLTSVGRSE